MPVSRARLALTADEIETALRLRDRSAERLLTELIETKDRDRTGTLSTAETGLYVVDHVLAENARKMSPTWLDVPA